MIEFLTKAGAKAGTTPFKAKDIPNRAVPAEAGARARRIAEAVGEGVALLQTSSDAFLENKSVKERKCISCHQQTLPAVAFGWARSRGLKVNEELLRKPRTIAFFNCSGSVGLVPNPAASSPSSKRFWINSDPMVDGRNCLDLEVTRGLQGKPSSL